MSGGGGMNGGGGEDGTSDGKGHGGGGGTGSAGVRNVYLPMATLNVHPCSRFCLSAMPGVIQPPPLAFVLLKRHLASNATTFSDFQNDSSLSKNIQKAFAAWMFVAHQLQASTEAKGRVFVEVLQHSSSPCAHSIVEVDLRKMKIDITEPQRITIAAWRFVVFWNEFKDVSEMFNEVESRYRAHKDARNMQELEGGLGHVRIFESEKNGDERGPEGGGGGRYDRMRGGGRGAWNGEGGGDGSGSAMAAAAPRLSEIQMMADSVASSSAIGKAWMNLLARIDEQSTKKETGRKLLEEMLGGGAAVSGPAPGMGSKRMKSGDQAAALAAHQMLKRKEEVDPVLKIKNRRELLLALHTYNRQMQIGHTMMPLQKSPNDNIFSKECTHSPLVAFRWDWAFQIQSQCLELQNCIGLYAMRQSTVETRPRNVYPFPRPRFVWEMTMRNTRDYPLLFPHGVPQPAYLGPDFEDALRSQTGSKTNDARELTLLSYCLKVPDADLRQTGQELAKLFHASTERSITQGHYIPTASELAQARALTAAVSTDTISEERLVELEMRTAEQPPILESSDELGSLVSGMSKLRLNDFFQDVLKRYHSDIFTGKRAGLPFSVETHIDEVLFEKISRAMWTSGADNKMVEIRRAPDVTFNEIARQNRDLQRALRLQIQEAQIEFNYNQEDPKYIETVRQLTLNYKLRACDNFATIWRGDGNLSVAANLYLAHLKGHLEKSKQRNFFDYYCMKQYKDTSALTDFLNLFSAALYSRGSVKGHHNALCIMLSIIDMFANKKMHCHMLIYGEHGVGKTWILDLMNSLNVPGTYLDVTEMSAKSQNVSGDISDLAYTMSELDPKIFGAEKQGGKSSQSSLESAWKAKLTSSAVHATVLNFKDGVRFTEHIHAEAHNVYIFCTNYEGTENFKRPMLSRFLKVVVDGIERPILKRVFQHESTKGTAYPEFEDGCHAKHQLLLSLCWLIQKLIWTHVLESVMTAPAELMCAYVLQQADSMGAVETHEIRSQERFRSYCQAITIGRAVYEHFFANPNLSVRTGAFELRHILDIEPRLVTSMEEAAFVLRLLKPQWSNRVVVDIFAYLREKYFAVRTDSNKREAEYSIDHASVSRFPRGQEEKYKEIIADMQTQWVRAGANVCSLRYKYCLSLDGAKRPTLSDPDKQERRESGNAARFRANLVNAIHARFNHSKTLIWETLKSLEATSDTRPSWESHMNYAAINKNPARIDEQALRMLHDNLGIEIPCLKIADEARAAPDYDPREDEEESNNNNAPVNQFSGHTTGAGRGRGKKGGAAGKGSSRKRQGEGEDGQSREDGYVTITVSRYRMRLDVTDPIEEAIMQQFSHAYSSGTPWAMPVAITGVPYWEQKSIPATERLLAFDSRAPEGQDDLTRHLNFQDGIGDAPYNPEIHRYNPQQRFAAPKNQTFTGDPDEIHYKERAELLKWYVRGASTEVLTTAEYTKFSQSKGVDEMAKLLDRERKRFEDLSRTGSKHYQPMERSVSSPVGSSSSSTGASASSGSGGGNSPTTTTTTMSRSASNGANPNTDGKHFSSGSRDMAINGPIVLTRDPAASSMVRTRRRPFGQLQADEEAVTDVDFADLQSRLMEYEPSRAFQNENDGSATQATERRGGFRGGGGALRRASSSRAMISRQRGRGASSRGLSR